MQKFETSNNLWAACAAGRKVFHSQMDKTAEIKGRALKYALEQKFPTYHSFGYDLDLVTGNLCDSKRFSEECKELELDAKQVAQHVVFEGHKMFQKVRDNGVKATFGHQVKEFNQPLYIEVYK